MQRFHHIARRFSTTMTSFRPPSLPLPLPRAHVIPHNVIDRTHNPDGYAQHFKCILERFGRTHDNEDILISDGLTDAQRERDLFLTRREKANDFIRFSSDAAWTLLYRCGILQDMRKLVAEHHTKLKQKASNVKNAKK